MGEYFYLLINREIFFIETRGGQNLGGMNHGIRSDKLYPFLEENLDCEIVPA